MANQGTAADPIEKVLADTVEASTYIGLPGGGGGLTQVTGVEIDTGDTLDGSIVYKKRIVFGFFPNSGSKLVAHSVTYLKLVKYEFMSQVSSGQWLALQGFTAISARCLITASDVQVVTTANLTTTDGEVDMYYTKV